MDETMRLRLDIAYDGTDFHGWARQKSGIRTVQQTIEEALSLVLRSSVSLTVAGRTDAGVHASGQTAHVDIPRSSLDQRSIEGDPGRLVRRLAKLLPEDVRVFNVEEAPEGFDARFSALARTYVYRVTTHPAGALPTRARDTAVWPKPINLETTQACADALVGLNNFAAFCRPKEHATTIRDVHSFEWSQVEDTVYEARIVADAFCWNMVRALTATCLTVGEGRRGSDWPKELLLRDERAPEVPLAPARGLTLVGVEYPADSELAARAEATRARREM
ncbi:tRNA pseudouridine(38-40) synthase [Corynebacterium sp. HMSC036E10]|uniref:tRNA pseudouridine synthase A n=1 Tax=Corynebacterium coyleae TaxID=53374 RepID=A0ABX8KUW7_9CORY|nr:MULTISPECIES: tRNA pseudouridine(38-40) synthase TruA [Corynebacterium]OFO35881.1 tRNA pseudouridine(38-40) synthase [Corynebacterium sp. HMSC075D04]OHO77474.1 tRNA pseudouridine(38-40) synthase [Corynebacterium sp. HMSC036E10]QXB17666.1 tRNA pseudouridine(38-40) synthase TruA [Corynebacterium coyleae]